MNQLNWRDAIVKVLTDRGEPLHYTEIAEEIARRELRSEFGATPAASVSATVSMSIKEEGEDSPFIRVSRGYIAVREHDAKVVATADSDDEQEETGLISAFGMFWRRDYVLWSPTPRLMGQQNTSSAQVDFSPERGVYLLHDGRDVVYVGRTTDQPLGTRLRQHTTDRLNGRWDRFSWFGVNPVTAEGIITETGNDRETFTLDALITTMEALLIEGLEPPQNRKRGDAFNAVEYLQMEDPEIQKSQIVRLMDELKGQLIGDS